MEHDLPLIFMGTPSYTNVIYKILQEFYKSYSSKCRVQNNCTMRRRRYWTIYFVTTVLFPPKRI